MSRVNVAINKKIAIPLLVLGAALASSIPVRADTVSLAPIADNTLFEDAEGDLSSGADDNFFAGRNGPSGGLRAMRGVLRFDVAGNVPAGATVTSAVLRLNMNLSSSGAAFLINVHRILQGWGEGTSTAPSGGAGGGAATAESATWLHTHYSTNLWVAAGGHYAGVESFGQFVQNVGNYTFTSASIISDVQTWLDTASTNFGWLVKDSAEVSGAVRFDSREGATATNRPTLIIGYSYTAPKPAFAGMYRSSGGFSNSWSAITGQVYQMEFTTNLNGAQAWTSLGSVTAITTVASMTDTNLLNYRLYRVVNVQY